MLRLDHVSLNTIASLVPADPRSAGYAILDLAYIFRGSMRRADQPISLADELRLARQYLNMEKRRLGGRLEIDWRVTELPADASVLPLMLMKPLSGSGALAVMTDVLNTVGPDSYAGLLASATQGSTETTFYVLAVYLGVIGVKNSRYILPACLLGDIAGYAGAVVATKLHWSSSL